MWSKKGIGFIAIIAHFRHESKLKRAILCLDGFNPPHTGKRVTDITEKILEKWDLGIHDSRISGFVTDD